MMDALDSGPAARMLAGRSAQVAEAVAIGEAEQRSGLEFIVDRHLGLTGIALPCGVELAVSIVSAAESASQSR